MAAVLTDQSLADAVLRLQVELLDGLGGDELHRWPLHRLGDRLSVEKVVLLGLRIGAACFAAIAGIVTNAFSRRLRWCAPKQASMPTRHGGRLANRDPNWLRDHF